MAFAHDLELHFIGLGVIAVINTEAECIEHLDWRRRNSFGVQFREGGAERLLQAFGHLGRDFGIAHRGVFLGILRASSRGAEIHVAVVGRKSGVDFVVAVLRNITGTGGHPEGRVDVFLHPVHTGLHIGHGEGVALFSFELNNGGWVVLPLGILAHELVFAGRLVDGLVAHHNIVELHGGRCTGLAVAVITEGEADVLAGVLGEIEVHGLLERAILLTGGGDFDLHLRGEVFAQVVLDGRVVHIVVDNEDTETTALGFVVSVERIEGEVRALRHGEVGREEIGLRGVGLFVGRCLHIVVIVVEASAPCGLVTAERGERRPTFHYGGLDFLVADAFKIFLEVERAFHFAAIVVDHHGAVVVGSEPFLRKEGGEEFDRGDSFGELLRFGQSLECGAVGLRGAEREVGFILGNGLVIGGSEGVFDLFDVSGLRTLDQSVELLVVIAACGEQCRSGEGEICRIFHCDQEKRGMRCAAGAVCVAAQRFRRLEIDFELNRHLTSETVEHAMRGAPVVSRAIVGLTDVFLVEEILDVAGKCGFVATHLESVAGREIHQAIGGHLPGRLERLHAVEADIVGRYGVVGVVVGEILPI